MAVTDPNVAAGRRARPRRGTGARISALGFWFRSGPASVLIAALMVIFYLTSLAVPEWSLEASAAGMTANAWSVFTAWLTVRSLAQLIFDVLLLLTFGVALERLLGTWQYLVVGFLSYWTGGLLALASTKIVAAVLPGWGQLLQSESFVGIAAFIVAVAGAATAKMAPLWRRRVQTFVVTVLVMLVLFAGYLGAIFTVLAWLLGLAFGYIFYGRSHADARAGLIGAGPQDGRILTSLIIAGVVVGDVISLSSVHLTGVLSSLQHAVTGVGPGLIEIPCSQADLVNCGHYQGLGSYGGLHILVPLLLQLVFAWGLRRGRRIAYVGTVVVQGTAVALASVNLFIFWRFPAHWQAFEFNGGGYSISRLAASVVVPGFILIFVISSRKLFTVRTSSSAIRGLLLQLVVWTVTGWLLAVLSGLFLTGMFDAEKVFAAVTQTYFLFLLPAPSLAVDVVVAGGPAALLAVALSVAARFALLPWLVAVVVFLRAFRQQELPQAINRETFIALTKKYGAGSMGWISTWRGNHYWGAKDGDGAVAYRASGGVALTVTDPVAAPGKLGKVLEEFVTFAVQQGLVPALYSIHRPSEEFAKTWGWPILKVAEESLLDLPELTFSGKKFQAVRTSLNRARKEGIEARWTTYADCPTGWKRQIEEISTQWVGEKPLPEMGFTLGGIAELDDPEVRLLVAVDESDRIHGVTSWMPIYEGGKVCGWTLDFMRRLEGGFRPVMEFLIASAALWGKEEGYRVLSLSGAPLAQVESDAARVETIGSLESVLNLVGALLEPVYGFRSLLRFKAKFQPRYTPVYLTLPTLGSLPAVGVAIGTAYLPQMSPADLADLGKMFLHR